MIEDATSFDGESYVRGILSRAGFLDTAKRSRPELMTPDQPVHWTEVVSIEELYGVPETHYIDKLVGYAHPEDAAEIEKLNIKHSVYLNPYYHLNAKKSDV